MIDRPFYGLFPLIRYSKLYFLSTLTWNIHFYLTYLFIRRAGMSLFPASHRCPPALKGTRLKDPVSLAFFLSLPPSFLPWGGRLIVWLFRSAMVKTQQIHLPGSIRVVGATSTPSHKAVHLFCRQSSGGGQRVDTNEWARGDCGIDRMSQGHNTVR